jgi:hypothetical protein
MAPPIDPGVIMGQGTIDRRDSAMSAARITVPGTIRPDGRLDLEATVGLPPGPVRVTIEPVPAPEGQPTGRGILDVLDAIHAGQRARGFVGRTAEEWEADRDQGRAEDEEEDDRWRTIWSQTISGSPPEGPA